MTFEVRYIKKEPLHIFGCFQKIGSMSHIKLSLSSWMNMGFHLFLYFKVASVGFSICLVNAVVKFHSSNAQFGLGVKLFESEKGFTSNNTVFLCVSFKL